MRPTEVFDYGKVVYAHIQDNPLVTRGSLNSHYRTSSNDQRNQNLTWVLEALLDFKYIFKHTDPDSAQVFYWTREYTDSPYEADVPHELSYTPVDVFGKRPVVSPPPPPAPMPEPMNETPPAAPSVAKEAAIVMDNQRSRLKGGLRDLYTIMMNEPEAIFGKNDAKFVALGHSAPDRARFLGRMFSMGAVRRLKDPTDRTVAYYTLYGVCPISLVEDTCELGKVAKRHRAELASSSPPAPAAPPGVEQHEVDVEDDFDEREELAEEDAEEEEEVSVLHTPTAFLGNTGAIMMTRSTGALDEFDFDESMALIELFLMTNHETLKERLAQLKAPQ